MSDSRGRRGPERRPTRRDALRSIGAVGVAAVAGCVGGGGSVGGSGGEDAGGAGSGGGNGGTAAAGDGTPDPSTLSGHPAAAGLADQPRLGPDPADAAATIIAFEDPSCTRCRAFEQRTVPRIEAELVEPGTAAYVFRGYPVVYAWGEPATQALESTYARDEGAFWALKDHYYADQPRFREAGPDGVLELTEAFLAAVTDTDAEAVVADAEAKAHYDAVQSDLAAGRAAGASITPSLFLFHDGRYVTKATGSVGFDVIVNALGL